jgi:2-polyprenyl-6-methoxyphenol hydroxylase-like FAD-dependent oxidoreductase
MLAPNALAALRELGLADCVVAEASRMEAAEIRGDHGRVLKRFQVTAAPGVTAPLVVLRPALHGALLNAIEPESLVLGCEAVGIEQSSSGVRLALAGGRLESGDILIGADGVGSVVRKCLHPEEPPARRSGYLGVRGVAYGATAALGRLSAVLYMARGIEAATVRASTEGVYWYMSLLAGGGSNGNSRQPSAIARAYGARLDDGFRTVLEATRPENLRLDELYDRDPISPWGNGRVTLLGDAAHPMLPHTGQGAALAMEDAVALGIALTSEESVIASLRRYERVRARRTSRLVRRGRRIAGVTTTNNPVVNFVRTAAIRVAPARTIAAAYALAETSDPHRALRGSSAAAPAALGATRTR